MLTEGQEILDARFKVIKKLGSGAFGEIFKGKCVKVEIWWIQQYSSKEEDWWDVCREMCKL